MKKWIIILLSPILCTAQQKDYRNLVLEGSGVRGLAYAGVLQALAEKNVLQKIERIAGSSSGAIAGMMVSIGYLPGEIDSMMINLPIQQFNDGRGGIVGKYKRFRSEYGIYPGEAFEKWLQRLVAHKTGDPGLTFRQLHALRLKDPAFRDLYCTGTNLTRQRLEIFSYYHTPDMPIALAVRISGGIPFYFEPIALDPAGKRVKDTDSVAFINYYVDGGMLSNYPISIFDTCETTGTDPLQCEKLRFNPQTIGIKLERPQQIDSLKNNSITIPPFIITDLSDYIASFTNLLMETLSRKYPGLENEKGRTIYVSQGNVSPKIKKTKQQDKLLLYQNGVKAVEEFFLKDQFHF